MRELKQQQKNNTILNPWWMSVALLITATATAATYVNVENMTETVAAHGYLMEGKAHYLPGKVCIIDADAATAPEDIVRFARACSTAHEQWIEGPTEEEEL